VRLLITLLGALFCLAGAAVVLLLLQYLYVFSRAGAPAATAMWAWHLGPAALLLVGGVALLYRARRFP